MPAVEGRNDFMRNPPALPPSNGGFESQGGTRD
jgi:hypothetical protein